MGLIGNVFEYVLKTFFGLETKVTQRTVSWLLAAPVYTDQDAYRELNELRGSIEVAAWALFTLVFCVSAVRYYVSGFTSAGSYEAAEALALATSEVRNALELAIQSNAPVAID